MLAWSPSARLTGCQGATVHLSTLGVAPDLATASLLVKHARVPRLRRRGAPARSTRPASLRRGCATVKSRSTRSPPGATHLRAPRRTLGDPGDAPCDPCARIAGRAADSPRARPRRSPAGRPRRSRARARSSAIASISARPNGSSQEGSSRTSSARISSGTSSRSPSHDTRSCKPASAAMRVQAGAGMPRCQNASRARRTWPSRSAADARRALLRSSASASIAVSCPFHGLSCATTPSSRSSLPGVARARARARARSIRAGSKRARSTAL